MQVPMDKVVELEVDAPLREWGVSAKNNKVVSSKEVTTS
jgi:hypothetical protein